MPYIVFNPVPPVNFAMGTVSGYTNGAFVVPQYNLELNAIALQLNLLQYQFSNAALFETGSASASMSATALNAGVIAEQFGTLLEVMKTISGNISTIANKVEVSTKGIATMSSHMAKQSVISQMQLADQITANEFNKQTANAAQEAAGLPKTVVTATGFVEKTKETIVNISQLNAQVTATSVVTEAITAAGTTAVTTAATWAAESALGTWIKDTYASTKLTVEGIFADLKVKQAKAEAEILVNKAKAGGV